MIDGYKEYLKENKIITIEECMKIHEMMRESIKEDEYANELYNEIIEKSIEYVEIRNLWTVNDIEWKNENDKRRTIKHDALIVKFNQLAKYLEKQRKDISWRNELGYIEDDPELRKRIGDFSCYLVYVHGINGR